MSSTPTAGSATANRSGRWIIEAATSRPPFEPPRIASREGVVYFSRTRCSPAAMKSSNTFCLRSRVPARCQSEPYSPPPRRFATA